MAPIKSILMRSATQLFGVFNTADLGLRGASSTNKANYVNIVVFGATGGSTWITPAPNGPGGQTRYYKVHAFTNSASTENFQVTELNSDPAFPASVEYYAIGGGGGGGAVQHTNGSGGGAGGFLTGSWTAAAATYTIRVGAGGGTNSSGTPTYIDGPNISARTAWGGGAGGPNAQGGSPGGSGGGAGGNDGPQRSGGTGDRQTGSSTPTGSSPPQGFPGGVGSGTAGGADNMSGGGGGASSAGGDGSGPGGPGAPKTGGNGKSIPSTWSIPSSYGAPGPDGSLRYFSGGGGAAGHPDSGGAFGAGGYGGGAGSGGAAVATSGGGGAGPNASAAGSVYLRYFTNKNY